MMLPTARKIHRGPPSRRLAASSTAAAKFRVLYLVLGLVFGVAEVAAHVGGGQPTQFTSSASSSTPVRTVMDLMEVMLNRDILSMLANGGYDFRQPARIFLPPKFYSSVPLDGGHMSPEEILSALSAPSKHAGGKSVASIGSSPSSGSSAPSLTQRPSASLSIGGDGVVGKTDHHGATAGKDRELGRGGSFGFDGKEQVLVLDGPDGSRINLISYSDGKVTSPATGGDGAGAGAGVNKGRDTLGKTVGLKSKPGLAQHRPPLTSSITDQTVSPNVDRTLPTSTLRLAANGGGSSTDRLRSALPGEPDVDYPIFGSVPATTFTCDNRHHGYYADVEARCQVFRVCANTDSTGRGFAFLCPNGTLFNQRHLVCDWYMNVRCADSENFYHVNEEIGRMVERRTGRPMVSDNRGEMMDVVLSMVTYPMRTLMEQMDGVGVLEERFGQRDEPRPTLPPNRPVTETSRLPVQPVRPSTYLTPIPNELEPPLPDVRGGRVPVNNYVAPGGNPTVSPKQPTIPNRAYTPPRVDEVYVSSLGTLSTDPDSGFDPVRSTVLTRTGPASSASGKLPQTGTLPVPARVGFAPTNRISDEKPSIFSKSGPNNVQLIKADLVKTWNGADRSAVQQTTPLRLVPVPQSLAVASLPRTEPQRFVERFSQPEAPRREQPLLPPTGVLPPTSFIRTVTAGQQLPSTIHRPMPSIPHRFTPVGQVLSVQKVTVQPKFSAEQPSRGSHTAQSVPSGRRYPDQLAYGGHVTTGNIYPTREGPTGVTKIAAPLEHFYPSPNPVVTSSAQEGHNYPTSGQYHSAGGSISHRFDLHTQQIPSTFPQSSLQSGNSQSSFLTSTGPVPTQTLLRRYDGPQSTHGSRDTLYKRKKTVLVQLVPSIGFYLNDAEEKRAYDEAVRRGLLDDRLHSTFTSYDVPQGSVGQL